MTASRMLGIVVNAPGIQERRARSLAPHLAPWFDVELLIRPSPRCVARYVGAWDVLYIIDPGAAGFPAAAIGKGLRRTTVVEVGDPQRELYAAQGRSKYVQLTGAFLDRAVARHAHGVVVRGEGLVATLGIQVPWLTIPDGVDLDVFQPGTGKGVRDGLSISDDVLVVGVVGTLHWSRDRSFSYGLDLIDAMAQLPRDLVHAVIVGDGTGLAHLKSRAATHNLENVHFVGRVAHEAVADFIRAMDVCVSTQSRDVIGRARTTAKLPEYLACDRFVLSTDVGTAAKLLPPEMLLDTDFAHWDDHVCRLRARLESLIPRQASLRSGVGTRALAVEHFSYPALGRRLRDFLDGCRRRRSAATTPARRRAAGAKGAGRAR